MRSSVSSPEVEPAKHVRAEQPHAGHPDGTREFPSAQSAALRPDAEPLAGDGDAGGVAEAARRAARAAQCLDIWFTPGTPAP